MRMWQMEDIREIMKNDLKRIGIDLDKDNRYQHTSFNPEDMRRKSPYDEFIFADERGYHYICYGWRESEHVDETFDHVDDLLYYVYRSRAFSIASYEAGRYSLEHPDCDWTAVMHSRVLEILKALGEKYYKRRLKEIEEDRLQEKRYSEAVRKKQ